MSVLLVLLLGCGSEPKPLTSTPVPPTEDLQGTLPQQTAWSDLEGFFPNRPGLPLATQGLSLGMDLAAAEKRLDELALGRSIAKDIDGQMVVTATLKQPPEVAVAIVSDVDQKVVQELQYTVPADQAERALIEQWGIPGGFTLEDEPSYFWVDEQVQIEWVTIGGRSTGLLVYRRAQPDAPPASNP